MIKLAPRLMVLLLCGTALAGCAGTAATTASNSKPTADSIRALAQAPSDLDSGIRQAALLRQAEHYDEAVHILSQLMLVASDDPRVVGEYGKTLTQMGRAQDATDFLGRAIQLQPNDWTLYSALGVAYDQVGDQDSARSAYEHALSLKPGEVSVLNNYALSRLLAKDPAGAQQLMERARVAGGATDPKIARNIALVDSLTPATEVPAKTVAAAAVVAPVAPQPKPVVATAAPVVTVPNKVVTAAPLNPVGQPHPLQPAQKPASTVAIQTAPADPKIAAVKTHGADKFAAAPVPVTVAKIDSKKTDVKPVVPVKTAGAVAPALAKVDSKPVIAQADGKKSDSKPVEPVKTASTVAPVATKPDAKAVTDTKVAAKADSKSAEPGPVKTANAVALVAAKPDIKPAPVAVAKSSAITAPASKPATDIKLARKSDAKPAPATPVKTANAVAPVPAKTDTKVAAKTDGKPAIVKTAADAKPASTSTVKTADAQNKNAVPALRLAADRY